MKTADLQAKQYDYDGAIATLNALSKAEDAEVSSKITEYEEAKAKLVPVDMNNITDFGLKFTIFNSRLLKTTIIITNINSILSSFNYLSDFHL